MEKKICLIPNTVRTSNREATRLHTTPLYDKLFYMLLQLDCYLTYAVSRGIPVFISCCRGLSITCFTLRHFSYGVRKTVKLLP